MRAKLCTLAFEVQMKHKLSVTLDKEIVHEIMRALSSGKFRNKSHVVEYAVKRLLEEQGEQNG